MTDLRTAAQQAIALICSARLCEVNSMSSRQEMLRLLIEATDLLRAALAEADEPVAWAISYDGKTPYRIFSGEDCYLLDEEVRRQGGATCKLPLYTHPPRREPLDDWAIETIAACCVKGDKSVEWALRAVERAHGIGTDE